MRKDMKVIGISRGNEFSPNHVDNDAAIFNKVVAVLSQLGCDVQVYTEKEFVGVQTVGAKVVFNMARDRKTITRLKELEDAGCLVINSAYGIDNCVRQPMTELLIQNKVPHPYTRIVAVDESLGSMDYPCWIKRGDSHAMVKEDVCYVANSEEACDVLANFRKRGIPTAVVSEHLSGDLIKFYGVKDSDFFYWFYPSPCSHSKFGLEKINGEAHGFKFEEKKLKEYCQKAASVLSVTVYGGDCVVASDGKIQIIDFNDWPSFARCREEAGESIAAYIYRQIVKLDK